MLKYYGLVGSIAHGHMQVWSEQMAIPTDVCIIAFAWHYCQETI